MKLSKSITKFILFHVVILETMFYGLILILLILSFILSLTEYILSICTLTPILIVFLLFLIHFFILYAIENDNQFILRSVNPIIIFWSTLCLLIANTYLYFAVNLITILLIFSLSFKNVHECLYVNLNFLH